MTKLRFLGVLAAFLAPSFAFAETPTLHGAVVVYAAPIEPDTPAGASFYAWSEQDVLELAVERCKAHTVADQWSNCAPGRWINAGSELLVASICDATDRDRGSRRLLRFLKDGVTATDEQIREAVQREVSDGVIAEKGCFKAAVFDKNKPQDSNLQEVQTVRSVAVEPKR